MLELVNEVASNRATVQLVVAVEDADFHAITGALAWVELVVGTRALGNLRAEHQVAMAIEAKRLLTELLQLVLLVTFSMLFLAEVSLERCRLALLRMLCLE